jgi:hypothetical protein
MRLFAVSVNPSAGVERLTGGRGPGFLISPHFSFRLFKQSEFPAKRRISMNGRSLPLFSGNDVAFVIEAAVPGLRAQRAAMRESYALNG